MDPRVKRGGDATFADAVWAVPSFPNEFTPKLAIIFSSLSSPVHRPCLVRSKASSIATPKTEQGAAADNACRNGAPRGARAPRKGPRAPGPPLPPSHLGPGSLACGWVSQTRPRRSRKPPGRLPALHSLPYWKGKENRETGAAGRPKTKPRTSGALAAGVLAAKTC